MKTKDKILKLLSEARKEWAEYKRTGVFPHWTKSCNAVWQSWALLMELKTDKKMQTSVEIRNASYQLGMQCQYQLCKTIHILARHGSPVLASDDELGDDIKRAISKIEDELDLNLFERFFEKHPSILRWGAWIAGFVAIALAFYGMMTAK